MASQHRANHEIWEAFREANIPMWVFANKVGVSDKTMGEWLRTEMSPATKDKWIRAIKGEISPQMIRRNGNLRTYIEQSGWTERRLMERLHVKSPEAVRKWLNSFMTPYEEQAWIQRLKGEQY